MPRNLAVEYRRKAADCLAVAGLTHDVTERVELLQIARGYLRLAEHIGTREPAPDLGENKTAPATEAQVD
jgi:hypothetical protein